MMTSRRNMDLGDRLVRLLDLLDLRIERSTFAKGADAPERVRNVGHFHDCAGRIERRYTARFFSATPEGAAAKMIAFDVRRLRTFVMFAETAAPAGKDGGK